MCLAPTSRNTYCPAICAYEAIARKSAAIVPYPPANQPTRGPNARAAQVKLVPQSGSAVFMCFVAHALISIGMNASTTSSGVCSPTAATTTPIVAARLYAGAVEAMPTPVDPIRPTAFSFRPFCMVSMWMPSPVGRPAVALISRSLLSLYEVAP